MAPQHGVNAHRRLRNANALPRETAGLRRSTDSEQGHTIRETAVRSTLRPRATAAVAIVGASLIATTSAVAPAREIAPPPPAFHDIALTSSGTDLLAPWIEQFNTASANATTLLNNFYLAPNVALQQLTANQAGFWQQLFDDPSSSSITDVNRQMEANLASVLTGYGLQNADSDTTTTVLQHTMDGSIAGGHSTLFGQIPGYLPADEAATITPIINFLGSPASGIIMGELGPFIAPWVALFNSITDGDNVNEILANTVGAFFNGATLNLDSLLPAINGAGVFPPPITMAHLDIAFGGLLSTGSVRAGPYDVDGTEVPAVGGSIFNSIGVNLQGVPLLQALDVPSQAIGPLGAWEGWAQTIAALLGWSGDGAPLSEVELPTIPVDDGGASASLAADSADWLQQLITGLFG